MREDRKADELRPISIDRSFKRHAAGYALISFGHPRVLCAASVKEGQTSFLRGNEIGRVTTENKPRHGDHFMQLKMLADRCIKILLLLQNKTVAAI